MKTNIQKMKLKGAKKVTQAAPFTNKPLTNREKLERMKQKNKSLETLINCFGLETSLEL